LRNADLSTIEIIEHPKIRTTDPRIDRTTELLLNLKAQESSAGSALTGRSQTGEQRGRSTIPACDSAPLQPFKLAAQHAGDNLSDLPPQLLEELSEKATRKVTNSLIEIIDARGGTATLDEILIDLYRKYKKVGKRASVVQRLPVLSRRGLCWLCQVHVVTIQPRGQMDVR
jgi:hypothetical protein